MTRSILPAILVAWLILPVSGRAEEGFPVSGVAPTVRMEIAPVSAVSTDTTALPCANCESKCDKKCGKLAKLRDWLFYRPARSEQCSQCCQGCNWPQLNTYFLYKCRWACNSQPSDPNAKLIDYHFTPECPCPPPFYGCCAKKEAGCSKGCK